VIATEFYIQKRMERRTERKRERDGKNTRVLNFVGGSLEMMSDIKDLVNL
jgi:hypothetical protein